MTHVVTTVLLAALAYLLLAWLTVPIIGVVAAILVLVGGLSGRLL